MSLALEAPLIIASSPAVLVFIQNVTENSETPLSKAGSKYTQSLVKCKAYSKEQ